MADTETKVKIEDTDPQSTNLASTNARQVSADVRPDHHKKYPLLEFIIGVYTLRLLDDMSTRIDDLEKNIGDLMNQAG
ncbi:hypothetical protein pdam_00004816, partial [Pocillopora damicornis]